ncbi:MAG: ABC-F family ATP-binding cassette domain-containing protein [Butyrivibrio sp.]|jgi:ATP-binding cassette subfamily F protein uup|nr:ABC-F family ATP-binding cassette domain-containing protein [Butyrivibrio sp.]
MKDISKAYTDKVLLDHVDFGIDTGARIGIIGINGTGKSTLLRLIAGKEEPGSGNIVMGNHVVIGYLPQNPDFSQDMTLYEYVVTENVRRIHPKDSASAKELEYELEGEAKKILNLLGFADIQEKISHLSGGQRKKAALCSVLLSRSDILLMDEPTNHLDNAMSEWLQQYLASYRGALVMVTHDRYFLDLVCNRIVEIDHGKLYTYDTNYEGYLELKSERVASAVSTQDKHANILRKELAWMQRGARARSTKQKAHIQRYEALRDEEKLQFDADVEISALSSRLGKKTIELSHVSKKYGERTLFDDFSFIFLRNDRVGILGPNGCGKTTLIKVMTGIIPPDNGTVTIGDTVKIGYYAQESECMDMQERVIDYVRDTAEYIQTDDGYVTASQMCEKFLFAGSMQYAEIGRLSGGERRRLYLLKVLMGAPNVLILDEPTNDLDIQTLCILEDYLDSFPGIVITVSHDRYFLDRVVRRMLTFDSRGGIHLYNGSYTEFFMEHEEGVDGSLSWDESSGRATAASPDLSPEKKNYSSAHKLKFSYKEQKEYETIEQDIENCEQKIAQTDTDMTGAATDFVRLGQLAEEKAQLEGQLEQLMDRYVYLEDLAEKIRSQE